MTIYLLYSGHAHKLAGQMDTQGHPTRRCPSPSINSKPGLSPYYTRTLFILDYTKPNRNPYYHHTVRPYLTQTTTPPTRTRTRTVPGTSILRVYRGLSWFIPLWFTPHLDSFQVCRGHALCTPGPSLDTHHRLSPDDLVLLGSRP